MTPEQRSRCMSHIRSKDTKPEMLVRRYLFSRGLRYRLHVRKLPGSPDIVLPKYRTAIFINGCFWHGHEGCKLYKPPKSNREFWSAKIERNRERDRLTTAQLQALGWKVIRVWECRLRAVADRYAFLSNLYDEIVGDTQELTIAAEPIEPYGM